MSSQKNSQNKGSIDQVSDTALWVAHYRAQESSRADALFRDPYAADLSGERGKQIAQRMAKTSRYTAWVLAIRTCLIDDYIREKVSAGVDLVLNLGAGLDSRPYRMALPADLKWIEVDYPHMIDYKEKILADEKPHCQLERVRLDLAERAKRQKFLEEVAAGSKKILVITEGVIPYLTEEQVSELAEDLSACPGICFWITEYIGKIAYPVLSSAAHRRRMQNAPFLFFPEDWWGVFRRKGWTPQEIRYLGEESIRRQRALPGPWWMRFLAKFMSKKAAEEYRRMMGYAVLVRA